MANKNIAKEGEPYRWKKGCASPNPGGRPKKLTRELEAMLDEIVPGDQQRRTYRKLLIEATVKRAIAKSDVLVREIFDRVEGKSTQHLEVAGPEGGAIPLDLSATLERVREMYGLDPRTGTSSGAGAVPLSEAVDRRLLASENSK